MTWTDERCGCDVRRLTTPLAMRLLSLLILLVTAPALAQEANVRAASGDVPVSVLVLSAPHAPAAPEASQGVESSPNLAGQLVLTTAGVAVSVGLLNLAVNQDAPGLLLLIPVASGAAVYGLGEALGYDGSAGRTFAGAALGALPGVAMVGLGVAMESDGDELISDGAVVATLGVLLYIGGSAAGATEGYVVAPTIQRTPEGDAVSSLGLRIGL